MARINKSAQPPGLIFCLMNFFVQVPHGLHPFRGKGSAPIQHGPGISLGLFQGGPVGPAEDVGIFHLGQQQQQGLDVGLVLRFSLLPELPQG